MEVVVTRTRLKPGKELAYEQAHAVLPDANRDQLLAGGIVNWKIFRDGLDLIHVITADPSFAAFCAAPSADPTVGQRWAEAMSEFLDDDADITRDPLRLVWDLANDLPGAKG
ncbi:MAG TPA: L-rhamnose mutarotase [Candidatus Lumbricidophila sp.]|nr:L-rhamnose mutarotase [Candidatus Lumbricidophila sp.]